MERVGKSDISVIMLTYNREKFVERAIKSILVQTFKDIEFIIVNNGSTDRSGMIADEYAQKDSRIRVFHRERGNIGSGRNMGLDMATGDYIAFVDDDDWAAPDFLEFLYKLATENIADVAICGAVDKAFDEKLVMMPEEALIELMWRKHYNMAFPTKLFTRVLGEKIRFPEEDKYDDISQMHRLLAHANRIAYHGLPKYAFYRHENNNSAWTTNHGLLTSDTLREYIRVYRQRTQWLCERFPKNAAIWRYFECSFMISMVEKIKRLGLNNCEEQYNTMVRELSEKREEFMACSWIFDFEKKWMEQYVSI
ncbi:glycosyltransferase, group 2 family protein [Desulfitobacterium hafniense DP7]|uniref:Glycosyltransferase, group 2 family protein n=1 Tax=Desulfitobacterium hafniense DP7 TaxID=537010 RepID=G9XUP1_DESHA|nr:glycosyltransferase family 2 protein [Desulfitobacterium hafniense]EHL04613.1 glycosyltransferase, group 2 family protein [Desulfitobacterium hafniense DP7]